MSRTDLDYYGTVPVNQYSRRRRVIRRDTYGILTPIDSTTTNVGLNRDIMSRTRRSLVTPDFHLMQERGLLQPLPFTYSEWSYDCPQGLLEDKYRNVAGPYDYDDIWTLTGAVWTKQSASYGLAEPSVFIKQNLMNRSDQTALAKISNAAVNLGEMWGERRETVAMIKDKVDRIRWAHTALKRGNLRNAAEYLGLNPNGLKSQSRSLANGWLELQYGWRPLLTDIWGLIVFLQKKADSPKSRIVRVVSEQKSSETRTSGTGHSMSDPIDTRRYEIRSKTCIYFRRKSEVLADLNSLGLVNPALISWNLTKYSFIADWFLGVSNWLNAFTAFYGYEYYAGCRTFSERLSHKLQWEYSQSDGPDSYHMQTCSAVEKSEFFKVNRDILVSWPVLGLPAFKDPGSVEHALNSLALLRQSFRR